MDIACDSTYVISATDPGSGNKEIKLYPNPVLKGETLQIEGMDVKEWILRNIQGKLISKGTSFIGSATINLSDNAVAGMYFMELRSGKYSYVKNLIIQ
ncbi:T9SS type A sorting domain-containing protein [Membranihabitans maritimus]|uniref:T9SS type A sorting domain-containing protein n=1 Tax=Membranihabitans maritimus TaxID=2904244 RepID=UPI001F385B39